MLFRSKSDLAWGVGKENLIKGIVEGKEHKIEVKSEKNKWKETGNIVIEIAFKNKPSGLFATTSKFWIHNLIYNDELIGSFIFTVDSLKKYLERLKKENRYRTVYGGENNLSLMVLIPIKNLHEIMTFENI